MQKKLLWETIETELIFAKHEKQKATKKLTNFSPMFHFYTPCKPQKSKGFLTFQGTQKWKVELKPVEYPCKTIKPQEKIPKDVF